MRHVYTEEWFGSFGDLRRMKKRWRDRQVPYSFVPWRKPGTDEYIERMN